MSAFEALRFVSADEVEADMLCYRGAGCWRRVEIFGRENPGAQRNIESRGQGRVGWKHRHVFGMCGCV